MIAGHGEPLSNDQEKTPRYVVEPAPNGVHPEVMEFSDLVEYLRHWPEYAGDGEVIEVKVQLMTDAEVQAMPDL